MSLDKLQEKIRKTKNPLVVDLSVLPDQLPPHLLESEGAFLPAYERFCMELLEGLRGTVPAVRLSFGFFSLLGSGGVDALHRILTDARDKGYYIFLEGLEFLSSQTAAYSADILFGNDGTLSFDGLISVSYMGTDGLRPYIDKLKSSDKDLFVVIRTANKTAPEIQDLLTGSRLVHLARVDSVNRYLESYIGKCGYSRIAAMSAATSADSLRSLRTKYKYLFILVDGYDCSGASAKNCANAFDKLGHGAIVSVSTSVTAAWKEGSTDGWKYIEEAVSAAEKIKKNLVRYITVL